MEARALFTLLDHAGDAAFAVDPQGLICYWSPNAEALLGFTRSNTLSRGCDEILRGEDGTGCAVCIRDCQVLEAARKNRNVASYDLYASTASGQRKWLNISIIVAHVKNGPSPMVVHLMRDISDRKQTESLTREIMLRVGELTGQQADRILSQGRRQQPAVVLTPRELSVLQLLSHGHDTKQISDGLHVSRATVRNHIQHILGKLRCHTRLEAVLRAARQGLI